MSALEHAPEADEPDVQDEPVEEGVSERQRRAREGSVREDALDRLEDGAEVAHPGAVDPSAQVAIGANGVADRVQLEEEVLRARKRRELGASGLRRRSFGDGAPAA